MKIGKENYPGFIMKRLASGEMYYGWDPTPKQRKAGWKSVKLSGPGVDLPAALAAWKTQHDKVEGWKAGGAAPRAVRAYTAPQTFGALLDRYEATKFLELGSETQRVDRTAHKRLRKWAGAHPVSYITRARVKVLREALMQGVDLDGPGHSTVFHTLTTLRKILGWWINDQDLDMRNPADEFGLRAPKPREQIWSIEAQEYFCRAAAELGWHSVALALRIGTYIGQREADILHLTRARWKEISLRQLDNDERLYETLKSDHGPDAGKVMGITVRQRKTSVWVGVPIEGALRDAVEAAIAAAAARARATDRLQAMQLIVEDRTGKPWKQRNFIAKVADCRAKAAELALKDGDEETAELLLGRAKAAELARALGDDDLATRIALRNDDAPRGGLEFRDLRRTCVVTLGMLQLNDYTIGAITGHTQATIKKILEVYMPRTIAAAARGVVARIGPKPAKGEQQKERQGWATPQPYSAQPTIGAHSIS